MEVVIVMKSNVINLNAVLRTTQDERALKYKQELMVDLKNNRKEKDRMLDAYIFHRRCANSWLEQYKEIRSYIDKKENELKRF